MLIGPGTRLGRYEIVAPIGEGGMGQVWDAVLHGPAGVQRSVALKLLRASAVDLRRVLVREARLGALVAHPNVVLVHDFGEAGGQQYVAMERVHGVSLVRVLLHGPLDGAAVVDVGRQVCAGLGAIHALGATPIWQWSESDDAEETWTDFDAPSAGGAHHVVVHRDIKPDNLLLDADGVIKVADLGLARATGTAGGWAGTPGYMPPEQYMGMEDGRADVFALGVTLARLATGSALLPDTDDVVELLEALETVDTSPLDRVVAGLGAVVARCVAVDASERWSTVQHLDAALGALRPEPGMSLRERARQLLPPVRPTTAARVDPGLPAHPTSFVGRVADVNRLARRLEGPSGMICMVGPAGVGKSRLVAEAVRRARPAVGGSWWVDALTATTPEELGGATARVLGLKPGREPITQVGHALEGQGPARLVLDQVDGLELAEVVEAWLAQAPELVVVATARSAVGVRSEEVFEVGPLAQVDAARLLADRSGLVVDPDDPAVSSLVDRLDGLPLALELAGAQAAERGGLPEGSVGGLDAIFDGSWALLSDSERDALTQLTVFEGGFSLEAAEAVLELSDGWAINHIDALVRAGLVQPDRLRPDRFALMRLVRTWARGRIAETAWSDVVARHARYFAQHGRDTVGRSGSHRRGEGQPDHGNLTAACRRSIEAGWSAWAAACAVAVGRLGVWGGPMAPAEALVRRVLRELAHDTKTRIRLLRSHGEILRAQGQSAEARERWEEGLTLAGEMGDVASEAECHLGIGNLLVVLGRHEEALGSLERVLPLVPGDRWMRSRVLSSLASVARSNGDNDRAEVLLSESLELARESGDLRQQGLALFLLSHVARHRGDLDGCRALVFEGMRAHEAVGDRDSVAVDHATLASIARERGQLDEARSRYQSALVELRRLGSRPWQAVVLHNLGNLEHTAGQLEIAGRLFRQAHEIARETGHAQLGAISLGSLGSLALDLGDLDAARAHLEQSLAELEGLGLRMWCGAIAGVLGLVAAAQGEHAAARDLLSAGQADLEAVGDVMMLGQLIGRRGEAEVLRGDLESARCTLAELDEMIAAHDARPDSPLEESRTRLRQRLEPR